MRVIRNYIDRPLACELEFSLPEPASNHLLRVLRLQKGDRFHLFNGDGSDYLAEITATEKKSAQVRIVSRICVDNESPLRIHLFQSIARGDKMDWILQKATELGVTAFTPVVSERTEVKLDGDRSDKKLAHWQGVIRSACEQSGRAFVPKINAPIPISRLPNDVKDVESFYLEPAAELGIKGLPIKQNQALQLAIGPEGGFSDRDIRLLQIAGFQGLSIGPRILRTETAGLAVVSAIQSKFGDWN